MAASSLIIANDALAILGATSIGSLSDSTKEARICNVQYDPCRKATLRLYPWSFAKKRVILDIPEVVAPEFSFENAFNLPTDFLRVIEIDTQGASFQIEAGQVLTNASELNLRYVYNVTDTTLFDPLFDQALAHFLAWKICRHITQSDSLKAEIWKEFLAMTKLGRFVNSVENPAPALETLEWIEAREGPTRGFVRDPQT